MEVVMLERYFVTPEMLDRIRASWIAKPIEGYVSWMTEHGYAARTVPRRVPLLMQFGAFAAAQGATDLRELPQYVDAFIVEYLRTHGRQPKAAARRNIEKYCRGSIEQMLRATLAVVGIGRPGRHLREPFVSQAAGFFAYLREERGLREPSIQHYRHFLKGFEAYLKRIECHRLRSLSPLLLNAFVTECARTFGPATMVALCSSLRVFLRYLRREGLVGRDLARSVVRPQTYRLSGLPRSIGWDEVRDRKRVV